MGWVCVGLGLVHSNESDSVESDWVGFGSIGLYWVELVGLSWDVLGFVGLDWFGLD